MRVALARHDEILRKTVEVHDGVVVKTTGDGLHAAFATADHALYAAVDAQLALATEVWPLPSTAARPHGRAHRRGRGTRRRLLRPGREPRRAESWPPRTAGRSSSPTPARSSPATPSPRAPTLVDLGEHRLRDLARAERVFQLSAPSLPREFPPPRSVDAFPGNLPLQLSSFIGREPDLAAMTDDAPRHAAPHAHRSGRRRQDPPRHPGRRAIWSPTTRTARGSVSSPRRPTAMRSTRSWWPRSASHPRGSDSRGSVVEYLGNKELLLVLDNCEHLLDDAGALAESILRECPKVSILATSREGLGVEGEHMRVVRSLPLPDAKADPGAIAVSATTQLFVDRARAAHGDVVLDDAALHDVAEICRRLDGIPLAIELAAARVVGMAPAEIARRLDERFRLLTGGRRTAVERHHTLRATVDWSYSLLGDSERLVFDRLGAFSGSFDTAAAEAVTRGDELESWDVVDALTDLAAKSMIVREPRSDTTRYTMLETLRQYARERLDERDEADAIRHRHAMHYGEVAAAIANELQGTDELEYRARLRDDLDNLRAAVTWGLDATDPRHRELGMRIIADLALEAGSDKALGLGAWAIRAMEFVDDQEPWVRCGVLAAAAEDLRCRAESERARDLAARALSDSSTEGNGPMLAIQVLTSVMATTGEPEAAKDRVLAAKAMMEQEGGARYAVALFATLGSVWCGFAGELDRARDLADEALAIAEELGSPTLLAAVNYARGNALHRVDPEGARRSYEESIALDARRSRRRRLFRGTRLRLAAVRSAR